jgi:uncharacterized 2Fe-2S/4Fe-4S cluster protein (DUF4445 family)
MPSTVRIELLPLGKTFEAPVGVPLNDLLFQQGVEFPCGGRGRCRGCRVRVVQGVQPPTPEDERLFTGSELSNGWRLACRIRPEYDLKLELAQWEAAILSDDTPFEFQPLEGLGVAVDLGTTTLVTQLVDLATGGIRAVRTALNPQAVFGGDIMSRIESALSGTATRQSTLIREAIGGMIRDMFREAGIAETVPLRICLAGNTVMHHLFCGLDLEPLSHVPFESPHLDFRRFPGGELGWENGWDVRVLPCLGGFVGGDILAGILATRLHLSEKPSALIDLGTNGEIVIGGAGKLLCASTAAGPAFEGARIAMGMRATTGAITSVRVSGDRLECHAIGNGPPTGICGSGLVDAVAALLRTGAIKPSGRLARGESVEITPTVYLTQKDIRELQFAKGAIAAGIRILAQELGLNLEALERVHLAGAFGNYINPASAQAIGLLPFPPEKIHPVGNSSLLGAKMALFTPDPGQWDYRALRSMTTHRSLSEDLEFQAIYAEEMGFPPEAGAGA